MSADYDFEAAPDHMRQAAPRRVASPESGRATGASVGRQVASPAMGTGSVIALQRSAGNRAVSDMLGAGGDLAIPVQREAEEEEGGEEETEEG